MLARALSSLLVALTATSISGFAQDQAATTIRDGIADVPQIQWSDDSDGEAPVVAGWTFEPVGYARDVGRRRVVRIGPEGDAELEVPTRGEGVVLRGRSDTARGDLVSAPFAMDPYRWAEIELEYRVESGRPLVFVGLRPIADRALVDLDFVPNRRAKSVRRETVRLHSSGAEGPYVVAVSVGGIGAVRVLSIAARETEDYRRPTRPLGVLDIRSADPELAPSENFARVASLFGFPSVEYVHYLEFTPEKLDAIDPAVLVLPGLWSSKGMDAERMDASVLAAVARDVPVVGICLGHQVLARAQGASLGRSPEWGPTEIRAVRRDPLFADLPRRRRFFNSESHNYVIEAPIAGMDVIASSVACAVQVVRYRDKRWYSFQGHIERGWDVASPEAVLLWKNMLRTWGVIADP